MEARFRSPDCPCRPTRSSLASPGAARAADRRWLLRWDHLIYAYMIENTRVYEIFRRVAARVSPRRKARHAAGCEHPELAAQHRGAVLQRPAPFLITNVSSHIRSDLRANRRNAYQRMFGMDLNHGADDGKPYPYVKAEAANSEFVATFEEFLREVWVGITYVGATSSSNPTDDSKIADWPKSCTTCSSPGAWAAISRARSLPSCR